MFFIRTQFNTYEELLKNVQQEAMNAGYVLTIKKLRKDRNNQWNSVELRCDRGGTYTPQHTVRQCGTRIIECPFEVVGSRRHSSWSLAVKNDNHNHDPSDSLSGHPKACRLAPDTTLYVDDMTNAGVSPRNIISVLKTRDPEVNLCSKMIYNQRLRHRLELLNGRSPLQALFDVLRLTGYFVDYLLTTRTA